MKLILLVILNTVQLWHVDARQPLEHKTAYLTPVAAAVHTVASDLKACPEEWGYAVCAAWLLALGEAESGFALLVVEDNCREHARLYGPDCDRFKAKTPWQCWRAVCPAAHAAPPGSFAQLAVAARDALRRAHVMWRKCGRTMRGAFSGYRQSQCDEPFAVKRAKRFEVILQQVSLMKGSDG